jgi:hypothetical protein
MWEDGQHRIGSYFVVCGTSKFKKDCRCRYSAKVARFLTTFFVECSASFDLNTYGSIDIIPIRENYPSTMRNSYHANSER